MVNVTLAEKYAIIGGLVLVVVLGSSSTFTKSAFGVCTKSGTCADSSGLCRNSGTCADSSGPFTTAFAKHNAAGTCVGTCAIFFHGQDKSATSIPSNPPNTAQNGHTKVTSP
jgi:hypothetical protein